MSAATITVTCAKCSRQRTPGESTANLPADAVGWRVSDPPLIVSGVAIGTCPTCVIGTTFDEADETGEPTCGGKCEGNYESKTGTYFKALWGDRSLSQETWSCWERKCVETWLEEQGDECDSCGHYVSARIEEYRNGARHGSVAA